MSFLNKLCLVLLLGVCCEAQKTMRKEAIMRVPSLIRAAGYPVEKHRVTTPDGYILQIYRIPAGRRSANQTEELNAKRKKAIIILHGLGGHSSNFVVMGPKRGLAYLLADTGYDVWLANMRGTDDSSHTNLTRKDAKFWDYSFHEHGKYDVPVMIDRILNVTGLKKIMCLGHSLGVTNVFSMIAQRPEYNDKLIAFVALGPAVYQDYNKDVINLALNTLELTNAFRAIDWYAIYPQLVQFLVNNYCDLKQPVDLCQILVDFIFGDNSEQLDKEMADIYLYRIQPLSFKCLEHYGKVSLTGVFTTFSGGLSGPVVPYNLSNVRIPVTLLYGENDRLTSVSDSLRLIEEMKAYTVVEDMGPPTWHKFNHIDYVFAKDALNLITKPLLKHFDYLYNKYGPV